MSKVTSWKDCIAYGRELDVSPEIIGEAFEVYQEGLQIRSLGIAQTQKERWQIFSSAKESRTKIAALKSIVASSRKHSELIEVHNLAQNSGWKDICAISLKKLEKTLDAELVNAQTIEDICILYQAATNCAIQKKVHKKMLVCCQKKLEACGTQNKRWKLYEEVVSNDPDYVRHGGEDPSPSTNVVRPILRQILLEIIANATTQSERWRAVEHRNYSLIATEALLSYINHATTYDEVRCIHSNRYTNDPTVKSAAIRRMVELK